MKQAEICIELMHSYFKDQKKKIAEITIPEQLIVGTDEYLYYLFIYKESAFLR